MASSVLDSGPLEHYFRDQGDDVQQLPSDFGGPSTGDAAITSTVDGENVSDEDYAYAFDGTRSGDTTLVNGMTPSRNPLSPARKGWTGSLPNISGPSHLPNSSADTEDEAFAERFKYLICSSGLLEKDFVAVRPGEESAGISSVDAEPEIRARRIGEELRAMATKGKERWDLSLAGAALIIGLRVGLGVWMMLGPLVVAGVSTAWYAGFRASPPLLPDRPPEPTTLETARSRALTTLTTFISESHHLNTSLGTASTLLQPHASLSTHQTLRVTLHRLTGNMTDHFAGATSTLLALADRKELGVLGEMYDIPVVGSFFYSRRGRPQATSESEEEFVDLPRSANVPSPRRPALPHRPSSTPSSEKPVSYAAAYPQTFPFSAADQRTHSHHLSLISSPDDRFTSLPSRTPRTSKRASMEQLRNREDQGTATVRRIIPADIARRPPHERRITEADEEAEECFASASSAEEDKSLRSSDEETRRTPLPVTPVASRAVNRAQPTSASPFKRISSPLARRYSTMSSSSGIIPLRTAPLVISTNSTTAPPTPLLPSPFEHDLASAPLRTSLSLSPMPNPKRRSLQNMPYYPPSDDSDDPTSAGLSRTRSMPFSDLQALRSASATGSRSRRSSMRNSISLGLPSAFPTQDKRSSISSFNSNIPSPDLSQRVRRVESVSPLTSPALKASCLGIHLKRRRMACCLLGLKFDRGDEYWEEVRSTLEDLVRSMKTEREVLDNVLRDVQQEAAVSEKLDGMARQFISESSSGYRGKWGSMSSKFAQSLPSLNPDDKMDFAPKTADDALLLTHLETLSLAMIKTWGDLTNIGQALAQRDSGPERGELSEKWSAIRGGIGEMVREWERGKEVVARLAATDKDGNTTEPDERSVRVSPAQNGAAVMDAEDVPNFMRAWETDENEPLLETDQSLSDRGKDPDATRLVDEVEVLPPAGKDTIFESLSSSVLPLQDTKEMLRGMSREKRIVLTKLAREEGLTLDQVIMRQNAGEEEEKQYRREEEEREMLKKGGEVVDELRGVIGVIRRMKEGHPHPSGAGPNANENGRAVAQGHEEMGRGDGGLVGKVEKMSMAPRTRSLAELEDREELAQLNETTHNPNAGSRSRSEQRSSAQAHRQHITQSRKDHLSTDQISDTDNAQLAPNLPYGFDLGELRRSFKFPLAPALSVGEGDDEDAVNDGS